MPINQQILDTYSKAEIDRAIELLTYKKVSVLPKDEDPRYPILFVFRHGQSVDNAEFLFSGWRDAELTEKGIQQAQVLADKLANKKVDILVASDQMRAIKTMEIAISKNLEASALEIIHDKRLRERCYGDLQGTSKLLMQLEDPKKLQEYRRSYKKIPPNGESLEMVVQRVKEFIEEIIPLMKSHKINVAVSCHGNSIRGFRKYFEKLSDLETSEIETPLAQDYAAYSIK